MTAMFSLQLWSRVGIAALAGVLGFAAGGRVSAGPIYYQVQVNTSALAGQTGDILFQFNPASAATAQAKAVVSNFQVQGGAVLGPQQFGPGYTEGSVSGSLPGPATLNNAFPPPNSIDHVFTYGSGFSFNVEFTGPGTITPSPNGESSFFTLFLYDQNGNTPLQTDPSGASLGICVGGNCQNFGDPVAIATQVHPTPEPASLVAFGAALVAAVYYSRWRQRRVLAKPSRPA